MAEKTPKADALRELRERKFAGYRRSVPKPKKPKPKKGARK